MASPWLELAPTDPEPDVVCDRGVPLVASDDRRLHAPDRTLLLLDGRSLAARCSCWWTAAPGAPGSRLGVIGHYASADARSGAALLARACSLLADAGCDAAVGPMDGNTWRRYRFIVSRGDEPVFFLEPDNPDDWPRHWMDAGFRPLAAYTSALNDDLGSEDPRTEATIHRLAASGIRIRALEPSAADSELRRIFDLSLSAFSRNFLYTPIAEAEFLAQYRALMPHVRPELVLVAERQDALVGFMVAVPDLLQSRRSAVIDTVILKTIALDPAVAGMGLGGALIDIVQRNARALGYTRAIHALMHEANASRRISSRTAREIRRYALLSRTLS